MLLDCNNQQVLLSVCIQFDHLSTLETGDTKRRHPHSNFDEGHNIAVSAILQASNFLDKQ